MARARATFCAAAKGKPMAFLTLFVTTSAVFLLADALMLGFVLGPLFRSVLGDSLLDGLRLGPALGFYVLYMGGVMWFAAWPAFRAADPSQALLNGAVLGLVAYGTYELTSWAIMRNWSATMVAADMVWGAVVTGISAYIGVRVALAVTS
jgi:uncharacterized membrane protein